MSYRSLPTPDRVMRDRLRATEDRLTRLETGLNYTGLVSFGNSIQIGDVKITVSATGGDNRTVTFLNVLNGLTSTIVL